MLRTEGIRIWNLQTLEAAASQALRVGDRCADLYRPCIDRGTMAGGGGAGPGRDARGQLVRARATRDAGEERDDLRGLAVVQLPRPGHLRQTGRLRARRQRVGRWLFAVQLGQIDCFGHLAPGLVAPAAASTEAQILAGDHAQADGGSSDDRDDGQAQSQDGAQGPRGRRSRVTVSGRQSTKSPGLQRPRYRRPVVQRTAVAGAASGSGSPPTGRTP